MEKFFKALSAAAFALCAAVFVLVGFADRTVPDEFTQTSYSALEINRMLRLDLDETEPSDGKNSRYSVNVSILDVIPVKSSVLNVNERKYVIPGGDVIGLKLYTRGVVIVGTDTIDSPQGKADPAKSAGVQKGDSILSIDSEPITSSTQLARLLSESAGKPLHMVCERNGKEYETDFSTVKSTADGTYKAGLWIRDSAAGIGTMTYIDTENGIFAGLGHAVCDVDTGDTVSVSRGECVHAEVTGCNKGLCGQAGELCGIFSAGSYGEVLINCPSGIYGELTCPVEKAGMIPVAASCEVHTGQAQILSNVDGNGPAMYDVEITRVYSPSEGENRCLSLRVTDNALIEKTGGIVQGMSGSPILQDGMLAGAVTHVFVNDPTQGYGIFAEKMTACSDSLTDLVSHSEEAA